MVKIIRIENLSAKKHTVNGVTIERGGRIVDCLRSEEERGKNCPDLEMRSVCSRIPQTEIFEHPASQWCSFVGVKGNNRLAV